MSGPCRCSVGLHARLAENQRVQLVPAEGFSSSIEKKSDTHKRGHDGGQYEERAIPERFLGVFASQGVGLVHDGEGLI